MKKKIRTARAYATALAAAATISMTSCRTQDYSTDVGLNSRQEQVQIKVTRSSVPANTEDTVFARIQVIISDKVAVSIEQIHLNSNFQKDLGFDSLDLIEIIIDIENEFNIAIPDDAVENFVTVEDLVNYITTGIEPQPPKPDNPYPELLAKVQDIIQEQIVIPEGLEITFRSNLKTDLDMENLDIMELVMAVEEVFGIEISNESAEKFITVGDIVVYIAALQPTDPVPGPVISIETRLKNLISELTGTTSDTLSPETNLREDLGMDDLDFFQLIMNVEKEFGIEIPSESAEKLITVGNIIAYITALQPTDPVNPPGPAISIETRLKNLIFKLTGITSDMLNPETNLREDLGMDDLDFIDLIREIETEFDILISADNAAEMQTIEDILTYIRSQS